MIQIAPKESVKVELGAVVSQIRTTAMPSDLPADTWFIGLEDISPHEGQIANLSHVSDVRSRVFQFQNGDVLYGRLRPYLRKAAVADFDGSASGEIIVLRCSEKILPRYLLILMLSENFTQFVNERVKGDRPRTSFATIANYQFDLPPVEAQAEICERDSRLVAAMSKLAEARSESEQAAISLLDAMRSRLIWQEDGSKELVPLSELVDAIEYGTTEKSDYGGVGTPVLRIPNISPSGEIDSKDLKYAPLNRRDIERYRLNVGDLLLIRSNGSLSLVGRAAKVDRDHEGYAFAGYLLRLRPRNGVSSDYLLELVRSSAFKRMVEKAARSSTGINNLSAGRLGAFVVPLLPLKQQKRVVDTLTRMQRAVDSSSRELTQTWSCSKALLEIARSGWLGQGTPQAVELVVSETRKESLQHDNVETGDLPMDSDIEGMVLRCVEAMPVQASGFEALFSQMHADYDLVRDVVFKMLSEKPPRLVQVFDEQHQSIILRRPE
ncbi:restriction endonuclease subunit S [Burkholderia pseudomallei]|uniref:restriction endonuclease subunit S n=1 Tax=Burkholderia pseudomallei TaxID=28450 RepID=UPI0011AB597A|nr:restriction endonuclease subunit S [Burkholderia pseudomallei]